MICLVLDIDELYKLVSLIIYSYYHPKILYHFSVSIDQIKLKDSKNNQIDAIKSMPVVARIVCVKETYLNWILDMLNFTN